MQWHISEIPGLRGFNVEWAERGRCYLSRRDVVYRSTGLLPPFEPMVRIPAPGWRRAASHLRLAQRLLRFHVTNVLPLPNGDLFVTFDRMAGLVRDGILRPLAGLRRPCRVLRSACAIDAGGHVYFGEYLANDDRGPMNIYRLPCGGDAVEVVHTFPAGSVRHVHGIYRDDHADALYCLTGDTPAESMILRTRDAFASLETVGQGDETWRAVSLLATPRALYYGSDAEARTNHIYRIDRQSGERRSLGDVNGTVFYSKVVGTDLFFATTAENAPSQTENVAALWCVDQDDALTRVATFAKDRWHGTLFQFGTIQFPGGHGIEDHLMIHVVGVDGDNRCFRVERAC